MQYRKIAFIGAGNMVAAIVSGLVNSGYPAHLIHASSPSTERRQKLHDNFNINQGSDNNQAADWADVIVLGVKPQLMANVCSQLTKHVNVSQKLLLSIAAGIEVSRFEDYFQQAIKLIRVMPNTPSLIGQGMSGLFAPEHITPADKEFAELLMTGVGKTCWVEKESEMNHIIAVAGSAPAYFFLFMEAMQQEAQRLGFSEQTARLLVQQSALGAAKMVEHNSQLPISTLREQVTSKGGTTAKAIELFQNENFSATVAKAMQAAIQRAEEMQKQF